MNTSFIDTNYCVQTTTDVPSDALSSTMIIHDSITKSSFTCRSRYIGTNFDEGLRTSTDPFYWMAIGRWK